MLSLMIIQIEVFNFVNGLLENVKMMWIGKRGETEYPVALPDFMPTRFLLWGVCCEE